MGQSYPSTPPVQTSLPPVIMNSKEAKPCYACGQPERRPLDQSRVKKTSLRKELARRQCFRPFAVYQSHPVPALGPCRQMLNVKVKGKHTQLRTVYDEKTPHTLITHEAARRAGLCSKPRTSSYVETLDGGVEETVSSYNLPLISWDRKYRKVEALGVRYIDYFHEYHVPDEVEQVFSSLPKEAVNYGVLPGVVDLVIGADQQELLPRWICNSWDPEDNFRLMLTEFEPRFLVTNIREPKRPGGYQMRPPAPQGGPVKLPGFKFCY